MSQSIQQTISNIVKQKSTTTPVILNDIIRHLSTSTFIEDALEVDNGLWGGFWHFDVMAPGYRLPAVELALLRGIRLDEHWPEGTTVAQYLAELRQAITHPQAGVWTWEVIKEPCVICVAPCDQKPKSKPCTEQRVYRTKSRCRTIQNPKLATVVWYCATTGRLHAGYRTPIASLDLGNAVLQREPGVNLTTDTGPSPAPAWIREAIQQKRDSPVSGLVERLDVEILRVRANQIS